MRKTLTTLAAGLALLALAACNHYQTQHLENVRVMQVLQGAGQFTYQTGDGGLHVVYFGYTVPPVWAGDRFSFDLTSCVHNNSAPACADAIYNVKLEPKENHEN